MSNDNEFPAVTATNLSDDSRAVTAQVRILGATGDNDNAEGDDDCEIVFPQGFVSRPEITDTTEAVMVRDGDESVLLAIIDKDGPGFDEDPELEEGETRVYSTKEPESMVRLCADGSIELRPKDGQAIKILANDATIEITAAGAINITPKSGQDVVLNGGTNRVARVGDATSGHSHTVTGNAGPYPISGGMAVTQTDSIAQGAPNVKA